MLSEKCVRKVVQALSGVRVLARKMDGNCHMLGRSCRHEVFAVPLTFKVLQELSQSGKAAIVES